MTLLQIIIYIQTVNDNSVINNQALALPKAWFENKIKHRELEIHDFGLLLLYITHFIFHFWKYQCVKWEETHNRRFSSFATACSKNWCDDSWERWQAMILLHSIVEYIIRFFRLKWFFVSFHFEIKIGCGLNLPRWKILLKWWNEKGTSNG